MKYDKQAGYQKKLCKVCGRYSACCQHHLQAGSGRYHSPIIWVCDECHARIHANPKWARENGYLQKANPSYKKREKKIKCLHKKIYYNPVLGCRVCIICGKRILDKDTQKV